jgi:hypothetical protein
MTLLSLSWLLTTLPGRAQPEPAPSDEGEVPAASPASEPEPEPPPTPAPAEAQQPDARERARERFMRGVQLFEGGELDAALAEFRASADLYATRVATRNVAVCLRALGRYDEALEVLETIPRHFPDMPAEWRAMVERDIAEVARRVGTLRLEVDEPRANVLLAGRLRGKTPLAPLRVTSGSHPVRIVKPGFIPFEGRVEVAGGETKSLEVDLQPLAESGALRVVEVDGRPARVLVDLVPVGDAPWSGRLPPGVHVVSLEGRGNLATQPAAVEVKDGGDATLSLGLEPLSAVLRIEPIPSGAQVALDGVTLGRGVWEGNVRPGPHRVEVAAEGFLPLTLEPAVAEDGIAKVVAELERDPTSPAWRKKNPPRVVFELVVGPAFAPSMGGELDDCSNCDVAPTFGGRASLRGGYQLGLGIGFFADVGYLALIQNVDRREATLFGVADPTTERDPGFVDDQIFMHGVTLGGALGYAVPEIAPFAIHGRLGGGLLIGEASVTRAGEFTSATAGAYSVGDYVESESVLFAYVEPSARFGYRLVDRLELSLGLTAFVGIEVETARWRDQRGVPSPTPFFGGFNEPGTEPEVIGTFVAFSPDLGLRVDF